jgi:hypothetical protein
MDSEKLAVNFEKAKEFRKTRYFGRAAQQITKN